MAVPGDTGTHVGEAVLQKTQFRVSLNACHYFPGGSSIKIHLQCRRHGFDPSQEDSIEEEIATYSSILAWRTPWTEEPGQLQSMGSQTQLSN